MTKVAAHFFIKLIETLYKRLRDGTWQAAFKLVYHWHLCFWYVRPQNVRPFQFFERQIWFQRDNWFHTWETGLSATPLLPICPPAKCRFYLWQVRTLQPMWFWTQRIHPNWFFTRKNASTVTVLRLLVRDADVSRTLAICSRKSIYCHSLRKASEGIELQSYTDSQPEINHFPI